MIEKNIATARSDSSLQLPKLILPSLSSNEANKIHKLHDHSCLIYETDKELLDVIIPYLIQGLFNGERCLCIPGESLGKKIPNCFLEKDIDFYDVVDSGQLIILDCKQAYLHKEKFDPDSMIELLTRETNKAIVEGYSGLRITGDMSWVLQGFPGSEKILEYEAKLNDFFPKHPCLAICQYDRRKYNPEILKKVIMAHPFLLHGDGFYENFYYIPPEGFLGSSRNEYEVQHWLDNLEREHDLGRRVNILSNVLELSSQPFCIRDAKDGKRILCNPAFCELTGYSEKELFMFEEMLLIETPEWIEYHNKMVNEQSQKGRPVQFESKFRHKNGTEIPVEMFVYGVSDKDGKLLYHYGFVSDITGRIKAQQQLWDSEERFSTLVEASPSAIAITDLNGIITYVNKQIASMSGYDNFNELLGRSCFEFMAPEDHERTMFNLAKAAAEDTTQNDEYTFVRKDGSRFPARITTLTLINNDKKPKAFIHIMNDITEQKQREKELKEAEKARQESEKLLRTIFEQSPNAIRIYSPTGELISCNRANLNIFGLNEVEDLKNTNLFKGPNLGEKEKAQLLEGKGVKVEMVYDFELIKKENYYETTNSGLICLDMSITPIFNEETNKIDNYMLVAQDITERKQADKLFDKYHYLLENSNDMIYIATPDGYWSDFNENVPKTFGYTREELLGLDLSNLWINPDDRNIMVEKHKKEAFLKDYPAELKKKDGSPVYALVNAVAHTDKQGDITEYFGIIRDITKQKQDELNMKKSYEKLQKTMEDIISTLATIIETRDQFTYGHQFRVARLANAIANEMSLSEEKIKAVTLASFIHDIGKIYIPSEILNKPGALNQAEINLLKAHPTVGYDILNKIELPWPIAQIILQHHERVNGSGYPAGLSKKDICQEALILAVADVIDSMSSHRPYRPALGIQEALKEIKNNSGVLYDEEVVENTLKLFE